ncbi:MAG: hypothetical protein J6S09_07765 [Paludibacteraceae bacterium]|nr:hypothetical protein [Paludibacteraceae bacterium]
MVARNANVIKLALPSLLKPILYRIKPKIQTPKAHQCNLLNNTDLMDGKMNANSGSSKIIANTAQMGFNGFGTEA